MNRGAKFFGIALVALLLSGGLYVVLTGWPGQRGAIPQDDAAVSALARSLIVAAKQDNLIAELDLDLVRLMPEADDRTVQLIAALEGLRNQRLSQESRVNEAFTALAQADTLPGENILAEIYTLEIEQAAPDPATIAIAGRNLASLTALRDIEAALNIFSEVASLDPDLPLAWARLGHISRREGRDELAVRAYDMALFLAGSSGDEGENKPAVMAARAGLALIALRVGDMFNTETNSRTAMAIAEDLGDKVHMAITYSITGRILLLQRQLEQAEDFQQKALALEEELDRASGLAQVNDDLGLLARLRGDHEAAANFHRTALAHNETMGYTVGIARQAADLASDLKALGDIDAACNLWQRALPLFQETHQATRVEQMQAVLGINEC